MCASSKPCFDNGQWIITADWISPLNFSPQISPSHSICEQATPFQAACVFLKTLYSVALTSRFIRLFAISFLPWRASHKNAHCQCHTLSLKDRDNRGLRFRTSFKRYKSMTWHSNGDFLWCILLRWIYFSSTSLSESNCFSAITLRAFCNISNTFSIKQLKTYFLYVDDTYIYTWILNRSKAMYACYLILSPFFTSRKRSHFFAAIFSQTNHISGFWIWLRANKFAWKTSFRAVLNQMSHAPNRVRK